MIADRLGAVALIEAATASDSPEGSIVMEAIGQGVDVEVLHAAFRLGRRKERAIVSARQGVNASKRRGITLLRDLVALDEFERRVRNRDLTRGEKSNTDIAKEIGRFPRFNLGKSGIIKALDRARKHRAKLSTQAAK